MIAFIYIDHCRCVGFSCLCLTRSCDCKHGLHCSGERPLMNVGGLLLLVCLSIVVATCDQM